MAQNGMFRNAMGGFNKQDVLRYIDEITAAWDAERKALTEQAEAAQTAEAQLRSELRVAQEAAEQAATAAEEVTAGGLCAVTGLTGTFAGQALGAETGGLKCALEPVMTYRVNLPKGADPALVWPKLRQLEEEDPQLRIVWNERMREIYLQLMGEIQLEILKSVISERFGFDVRFGEGSISYRETIAAPVEGIGH